MLGQILLDVFHRVFLDSLILHGGIEVVEYRIECDAPVLDGFEAQQGVVDAAQLSGGDEDKRVLLFHNVVYRQEIFGEGNHQTSGSFYEHGIIAVGKFPGGTLYFHEVYRALVYAGGEVGGAGVGEYFGHGQPLFVFRQVAGSGEVAVQVDVLGMAGVAGLDELLGDDAQAALHKLTGIPGGAIAFSGICINAADEVDVFCFHYFVFFRAMI